MSTVGSTVLLVPLAVNLAISLNVDPMVFASIVATSTSNSFLISTHPVIVLITSPGGYRMTDFLRIRRPFAVLVVAVELIALNVVY